MATPKHEFINRSSEESQIGAFYVDDQLRFHLEIGGVDVVVADYQQFQLEFNRMGVEVRAVLQRAQAENQARLRAQQQERRNVRTYAPGSEDQE